MRDYYAGSPITVRVSGSYHDIGMFVSDIAHLSRIVTLNNVSINPVANRNDLLTMEATAKTFQPSGPRDEVLAQKSAAKAAQGGKK